MQGVSISVNDPTEFDSAVKQCMPVTGDVEIISKSDATNSGAPAVLVILEVPNADGTTQKVRAVVSVKNIRNALSTLVSAHWGEM